MPGPMLAAIGFEEAGQQVINALSSGSTYALLALGLAMVFSIMGLVNFAHGELVTVAAYTIYLLNGVVPFGVQIAAGLAAGALVAVLMERVAFRRLRGASFVTMLFATLALSVIVQNLFLGLVSPRQRGVDIPAFFDGYVELGPFTVAALQLYTGVVCAIALVALTIFMRRSLLGLSMRAAAQDFQVARLMGIRANRVIASAFAISGLLAAIAAVFIVARRGTVEPAMGFTPVLKAFIASVIGGLGSLPGAVLGGFILAAVEVGLDATLPTGALEYRDAFALLIVIVILYFRPRGILGSKEEIV